MKIISLFRLIVLFIWDRFGLQEIFVFGGLSLFAYGVGMIYEPAAWISAGAAIFWLGVKS